ncbi:unnamed protein product [Ascophyllum nodosum]
MALQNIMHRGSRYLVGRTALRSLCFSSERRAGYNDFKTLTVAEPVEAVFKVEINRPDKANAMSRTFFKELRQCFDTLARDPTCRAVIICGSGSVFSAGIDLEEFGPTFRDMTATSGEGGKDAARKSVDIMRFVSGMQETFASLNSCPKPVISAIHSACIGGGVDLVCATDIRLASSDAWFSVDIGLCADLGTLQRLPKLIGSDSLARELVFTARKFPAAEALASGFLSSTAENKQELLNRAITLGSEIAARSPVAIQGSKVNMNYSRDHPVDQALQYQALWSSVMLQTVDIPHAMSAAVRGKPPPTFPPL